MKRLVAPTLVLIGFFALIYAILISTAHTTTIAIFGAGYSVLLLAIYMLIIAIKNPNFSIWWPLSDNAAPAMHIFISVTKGELFRITTSIFRDSANISSDSCMLYS